MSLRVNWSLLLLFALVALLLIFAAVPAGVIRARANSTAQNNGAAKETVDSPRLAVLKTQIEKGNRTAIDSFWQEIAKAGSPMVEAVPGGGAKGADQNLLVTFFWRDQKDTRVIINNDFSKSVHQMLLVRLLDTDLWYKTYRMRNDARFFYQFCVDDPNFPFVAEETTRYPTQCRLDPLNPNRYERFKPNNFSVVELPRAPSLSLSTRRPEVAKGVAGQIQEEFKSTILNNQRKIFIYRPPGFSTEGERYPLIVVNSTYFSTIPLPIILDNLIAQGSIRPAVALMVHYPDEKARDVEANCNPKYADFLARELLPAKRDLLHATSDPKLTIVGGASMSGFSAACIALQHPDVFGNVLSQSGSYWWSPEGDSEDQWLTRQFAQKPRVPVRFYLSVGLLESEQAFRGGLVSMLHANRHFRDVLQAKGYTVHYHEINAGHDPLNWQVTLVDGLQFLLGNKATGKSGS